MAQYINKDALVAEIKRIYNQSLADGNRQSDRGLERAANVSYGKSKACKELLSFIYTLEMKEVDLKKLGEIARHLIAVKEHIEDMRLNKDEWSMLEKIGYPERFKALKGE